jgi:hypothetical protein
MLEGYTVLPKDVSEIGLFIFYVICFCYIITGVVIEPDGTLSAEDLDKNRQKQQEAKIEIRTDSSAVKKLIPTLQAALSSPVFLRNFLKLVPPHKKANISDLPTIQSWLTNGPIIIKLSDELKSELFAYVTPAKNPRTIYINNNTKFMDPENVHAQALLLIWIYHEIAHLLYGYLSNYKHSPVQLKSEVGNWLEESLFSDAVGHMIAESFKIIALAFPRQRKIAKDQYAQRIISAATYEAMRDMSDLQPSERDVEIAPKNASLTRFSCGYEDRREVARPMGHFTMPSGEEIIF